MTRQALRTAAMLLLYLTATSVAQPIDSAAEFVSAAGAGDTAKLTAYLARGFDINSQDPEGEGTALHVAIANDSYKTIRYLLAHGADVNAAHPSGTTPLMEAAFRLNRRAVRDLLAAGADPRLTDSAGYTPLTDAGDGTTIRLLAAAGTDFNQANDDGETPILRAAGARRLEAVLTLLSLGADPNRQSQSGLSPLLFAVYQRDLRIAQALINGGALVNSQNNELRTPILVAVEQDHVDMVSLLLVAGGDPDLRDADGKSARDHALAPDRSIIHWVLENAEATKAGFHSRLTTMFVAAQIGDTASLLQCLDAGLEAEALDSDGLTALQRAAATGHAPIIRCLVANGASVKSRGSVNWIPLRNAVHSGHLEAVNTLIHLGSDVADLDSRAGGLLTVAAMQGYKDIVERLVAAGAPLDAQDQYGKTALDNSLFNSDDDIAAILRAAGARERNPVAGTPDTAAAVLNARPTQATTVDVYLPSTRDHELEGHLFAAAEFGDLATVQGALDAGAPVDAMCSVCGKATVLILAARNGQTPVVKELLSRGAEIEAEDGNGSTALMAAIYSFRDGTASALLKSGARPNTVTKTGHTALIAACSTGNIVMVNTLLDAGADPGLGLAGKGTPLIMSVKRENKEIVELLLAKGADVNAPGIYGMTPLVEAALADNTDIARTLLAAGAQVDPPMTEGWKKESPLNIATTYKNKEMVKLLTDAGAVSRAVATPAAGPNQPTTAAVQKPGYRDIALEAKLFLAVESGNLDTVRSILDGGLLTVNTRCGVCRGATLLILAAIAGQNKSVKELISRGAEIEAEDSTGMTALIAAIDNGHDGTANELLKSGAKPNTITSKGRTALIASCTRGNPAMVNALLKAGADPNLFQHTTPLVGSVLSGQKDLVKLLLAKGAEVNAQGHKGTTALWVAVNNNYTEIARILLAAGARADLPMTDDYAGTTALSLATAMGNPDMVKLFTDAGEKP